SHVDLPAVLRDSITGAGSTKSKVSCCRLMRTTSAVLGPREERVQGNPSLLPVSKSPDATTIAIVPAALITNARFASFFLIQPPVKRPSRNERVVSAQATVPGYVGGWFEVQDAHPATPWRAAVVRMAESNSSSESRRFTSGGSAKTRDGESIESPRAGCALTSHNPTTNEVE